MKFIITGKRFFVFPLIILTIVLGSIYYHSALILDHSHSPSASSLERSTIAPTQEESSASNRTQPPKAASAGVVLSTSAAPKIVFPSLEEFSRQLFNGHKDDLRGIYVDQILALRIVQQPEGNPAYVSTDEGTVTQFYRAAFFGVTGLLAHNFLSGRYFFRLKPDQDLVLVHGDGGLEHYKVTGIADYQRLIRTDIRSNFRELNTDQEWTTDQVFARFYQNAGRLILQTCLAQKGVSDWGVRFISAELIHASK